MLFTGREETELLTQVAPAPNSVPAVHGTAMGLDEIHLIQAARLYRNENNELVRVVFHEGYTTAPMIGKF